MTDSRAVAKAREAPSFRRAANWGDPGRVREMADAQAAETALVESLQ